MRESIDLLRGWMTKAASDLHTAQRMLDSAGPYDTVCFHAQQTIEKVLNGWLTFHEQIAPRTHDLEELQGLCLTVQPLPGLADLDLVTLSDYAVLGRYDFDFWPDRQTAVEAVAIAEQIYTLVADTLPVLNLSVPS